MVSAGRRRLPSGTTATPRRGSTRGAACEIPVAEQHTCPRSGAARRRPRARASTSRHRWRRAESSPLRAGSRARRRARPSAARAERRAPPGAASAAAPSSALTALPPCPRYALITCSFRMTSAVGPEAISLPKSSTAVVSQQRGDEAHVVVDQDRRARRSAPGSAGSPRARCARLVRPARPAAGSSSSTILGSPTTARASSTSRRSRAPSPPTFALGERLEPDEVECVHDRLMPDERGLLRSARGSSPRCRTPRAARSPARSGTCAGGPSAPAGSRPA